MQNWVRTFSGTDELRSDRRFRTELAVIVNTSLDDQAGWILDISRRGVKLGGIKAPRRARLCINFKGQAVQGTVRWCRPGDIAGIALDEPLQSGPLATVWQRYFKNVEAFGKYSRKPPLGFGRKNN